MNKDTAVRFLVDAKGQPQGVLLDEELWQHVCKHVLHTLEKLCPSEVVIIEPMADLQLLEKYWDLRYELPTDVATIDTLIAAHALSLGATVVTNNEREFQRVPGLTVVNWAASG